MTCPACGQASDRPLRAVLDGRGAEFAATEPCLRCRAEVVRVMEAMSVMATRPAPPAHPARLERSIRAALAVGDADEAPAPSRRRWLVLAAAATAAVVVAWVGVALLRGAPGASLAAGEVLVAQHRLAAGEAVPFGEELAVEAEAELVLPDRTRVVASAGTGLVVASADQVLLRRGTVRLAVRHRSTGPSFRVQTAAASVRVVGTQFSVACPADAEVTTVAVTEGLVEVTSRRSGEVRRLGPGDQEAFGALPEPPPPVQEEEDAGAVADEGDAGLEAPPAGPPRPATASARQIRAVLREGRVDRALSLWRAARGGARGADAAELAVVGAEILVAQGRYDAAIAAYRAVHRDFPRSSQGDEALFAAGQLALQHQSRREGRALLTSYLEAYPRGRFVDEATRLLDVVGEP